MVMLKPARTSMLVTTVTAEMRLEILSKNRTSDLARCGGQAGAADVIWPSYFNHFDLQDSPYRTQPHELPKMQAG